MRNRQEQPPPESSGVAGSGEQPLAGGPPTITAWCEDRQLSLKVLAALSLVVGYLVFTILRPFLTALFIAVIIAIAAAPLHRWISKRIRRRGLAAMTTTAITIFAVLLPFTLVSVKLTMEVAGNYREFLDRLGNTSSWSSRFDPVIEQVSEQTGVPAAQLKSEITRRSRTLRTRLVDSLGTTAQRLLKQLMAIVVGATFLYPLIRTGPELRTNILSLLPLSPNRANELADAVTRGIIANVYGMLTVGIVEGILVGLGFWLTGIRDALLWGSIATVLSFIPYVGVSLVWVSGVIYLVLHEHWPNAVALALWGLIIVSTSDGIVRSKVISDRVKTNSLTVTLSLMGGLVVFGPIGFFVGPVTIVVLAALLRMLREEHAAICQARTPTA